MKYSLMLLLPIVLFEPVIAQVEFNELNYHPFINVEQVQNKSYAFIQNNADYHFSLVDLNARTVKKRMVRKGKGPGEAVEVQSAVYDAESDHTFIHKKNGQLLRLNLDGSVSKEIVFLRFKSNRMDIYEEHIVMSLRRVITPGFYSFKDKYEIGLVVDKKSLNVIDTLTVGFQEIGIDLEKIVRKSRVFEMKCHVVQQSQDQHVAVIEGVNAIFKFQNYRVSRRLDLGLFEQAKIENIKDPQYGIGVRIPAIGTTLIARNNTIMMVNGDGDDKPYTYILFPSQDLENYKVKRFPAKVANNIRGQIIFDPEGEYYFFYGSGIPNSRELYYYEADGSIQLEL